MTQPHDPKGRAARIAEIFESFFPKSEIGSFVNGEMVAGSGDEQNLTDPATGMVLLHSRMQIGRLSMRRWIVRHVLKGNGWH